MADEPIRCLPRAVVSLPGCLKPRRLKPWCPEATVPEARTAKAGTPEAAMPEAAVPEVSVPEFVLAVDLDGVCAQHTEAFRRVVARERNVSEDSLPLVRNWKFEEWGFSDGDFEELHRIAVLDYRMFRDVEPMPGCAEALWRLSDAGVWIRIVTHRLYTSWGHRVTVSDTVDWLDRYRIPYRDICFLADKSIVNADAHIEDAPHNIVAIRAAGGTAIVLISPTTHT